MQKKTNACVGCCFCCCCLYCRTPFLEGLDFEDYHGVCNITDGKCNCTESWQGDDCSVALNVWESQVNYQDFLIFVMCLLFHFHSDCQTNKQTGSCRNSNRKPEIVLLDVLAFRPFNERTIPLWYTVATHTEGITIHNRCFVFFYYNPFNL